jgi:hypothetical protein
MADTAVLGARCLNRADVFAVDEPGKGVRLPVDLGHFQLVGREKVPGETYRVFMIIAVCVGKTFFGLPICVLR